jgi:hypothetical protein
VLTVHTFRQLPWPSTISVGADYSPSTLANYSLGSRWLTLQTNCLRRRRRLFTGSLTLWTSCSATTTTPVTVGIQPKVAFVRLDRSHLAQPFRNALSWVGYWGNICCLFTMYSSGFILGIANRYHGYRFAVEWQRHRIPGNLLHRQPVTIIYISHVTAFSCCIMACIAVLICCTCIW